MANPHDYNAQVNRTLKSLSTRVKAADVAKSRADAALAASGGESIHNTNGDELLICKAMNFTKG
ncbi:MAG TPA: hypothetical protein DDW75_05285, partial [Alteromonas australica]|nr:hypothetical protein [Alteromonas australica]